MPAQSDYLAHFRRYADAYEQSLGDHVEADLIRSFFADDFMALATAGGINVGKNDESFTETLEQGYQFYKAIGTRSMKVQRVEVTEIADNHDRVRVFYSSGYRRKDGSDITIDFDVTYLTQRTDAGPKIFAFIAGDELGLFRQHGLVDDEGKPI
ncbi:nuclear transport factor 2 family protein [Devosia sediminis]|uniref:Nuclear transport factor 2 family protein n=1 Tax=Devosia sediminis TaxID=2798801 RepID=A0A934IVW8_9HYPH|nr:nuclear transport factor 2 family protein [Devosia sediminis]MBJ3783282.1 nuclear transport factor 2 family protein [Devosia sediminis]